LYLSAGISSAAAVRFFCWRSKMWRTVSMTGFFGCCAKSVDPNVPSTTTVKISFGIASSLCCVKRTAKCSRSRTTRRILLPWVVANNLRDGRHLWRRVQQAASVCVSRAGGHLLGVASLHDLPPVHDCYSSGQVTDHRHGMGDEQISKAELAL